MTQTISELWHGNIAPSEHCGSHDPQANELIVLMERNRSQLSKSLTESQMETFQKHIDCCEEYLLRMTEIAFCDGFSLGCKLTTEALI